MKTNSSSTASATSSIFRHRELRSRQLRLPFPGGSNSFSHERLWLLDQEDIFTALALECGIQQGLDARDWLVWIRQVRDAAEKYLRRDIPCTTTLAITDLVDKYMDWIDEKRGPFGPQRG